MKTDIRFYLALIFLLLLSACSPTEQPDSVAPDMENSPVANVEEAPPPFTFLFFSDTQSDPELMDYTGIGELLAQAVTGRGTPELIIFGGDTVNDGGDEDEWRMFRQAAGTSLTDLTTAAAAGNHDAYPVLAEYFDYPVTAPASPGEGFFYTFSMDSVFFIVLDSNIMGAANQSDADWLRSELQIEAARQADWRIAIMHHPMWPVSDIPRDMARSETMREYFLPVLEANGVELILCGHQHVFARSLPMRGEAAADDGRGIVQIMAASGDKASYQLGERDFLANSESAPNYLRLIAESDKLTVTAFDGEHRVFDTFQIQK